MKKESFSIIENAKWVFIIGIIQKITTFSLNQFLISIISPEILGKASISLELLLSTLLFLSREGIRLSCMRNLTSSERDVRALIRISWLPSIIIIPLSLVIIYLKIQYSNYYEVDFSKTRKDDLYIIILYSIAAFIECLGEPWVNISQNRQNLRPRINSEAFGLFFKSLSTFIFLYYYNFGIFSFAISQLVYSVFYLFSLVTIVSQLKFRFSNENIIPASFFFENMPIGINLSKASEYFDSSSIYLAFVLSVSSIVKHFITEADKLVLSFSSNLYDQGIYSVASNYGSLIVRLLFLPMEDASRLYFSSSIKEVKYAIIRCQGVDGSIPLVVPGHKDGDNCDPKTIVDLITDWKNSFFNILKFEVFLGVCLVLFGMPHVDSMVPLLFSSNWDHVYLINTITTYLVYILLLGINGILEAFIHSTITSSRIIYFNFGIAVSFFAFFFTFIFTANYMGTISIVLANAVATFIRIVNNFFIISNSFSRPVLLFEHDNEYVYFDYTNDAGKRVQTKFDISYFINPGCLIDILEYILFPFYWWVVSIFLGLFMSLNSNMTLSSNPYLSELYHLLVSAIVGLGYVAFTLWTLEKNQFEFILQKVYSLLGIRKQNKKSKQE